MIHKFACLIAILTNPLSHLFVIILGYNFFIVPLEAMKGLVTAGELLLVVLLFLKHTLVYSFSDTHFISIPWNICSLVLAGIGEDDEDLEDTLFRGGKSNEQQQIGPNTVTEQSGEALAQLCMWQLVVGFNLRELEVRDKMKNMLGEGNDDKIDLE